MSTCSKCQGTGSQLPEALGTCRLCRGSGSRVPYPLAHPPLFDKAASELEALALELKDGDETSPYKRGYLVTTLREAAGMFQFALREHHNLGVVIRLRDKERGAAEQLQEVEELLACHTVRGRRMHRRAQRAEGELTKLRRRWRALVEQDLARHTEAVTREKSAVARENSLEAALATVRQERDQEWRRCRELEASVARLERELAEARLGRFR